MASAFKCDGCGAYFDSGGSQGVAVTAHIAGKPSTTGDTDRGFVVEVTTSDPNIYGLPFHDDPPPGDSFLFQGDLCPLCFFKVLQAILSGQKEVNLG